MINFECISIFKVLEGYTANRYATNINTITNI